MKYTKPEVAVLGTAKAVIEQISPKPSGSADGTPKVLSNPAYDLDE
jgi:hypothetical protein